MATRRGRQLPGLIRVTSGIDINTKGTMVTKITMDMKV